MFKNRPRIYCFHLRLIITIRLVTIWPYSTPVFCFEFLKISHSYSTMLHAFALNSLRTTALLPAASHATPVPAALHFPTLQSSFSQILYIGVINYPKHYIWIIHN